MSKMYGKRRVVLETKPTHLGNRLVTICGSDAASAIRPGCNSGSYFPIGFWYKENGLFYVDLKSEEQFYRGVNRETIAHKGWGGLPSKQSLRKFVMNYFDREREARG
jgi:hypothetical protein